MTDEKVNFHFEIDGDNFTSAGEASVMVKKVLRQMGFSAETIRRVSVAMYEGEINMVIHANGGVADVNVYGDKIEIIYMIPGWTHNIINLSDTEDLVTVMTCNEIFDPEHPDTFGELV